MPSAFLGCPKYVVGNTRTSEKHLYSWHPIGQSDLVDRYGRRYLVTIWWNILCSHTRLKRAFLFITAAVNYFIFIWFCIKKKLKKEEVTLKIAIIPILPWQNTLVDMILNSRWNYITIQQTTCHILGRELIFNGMTRI